MDDFRRKILKVDKPRTHKVRNSLGTYDAYKWIRRNKWLDIGRTLTEHEFYSIIRKVNDYLANSLINGEDITFPNRMGTLELRKYRPTLSIKDNKLKSTLPIDWDRTLKLWAEDEESYKKRTLVKAEEKEIFKLFYNKKNANYMNKSFYSFDLNRDVKKKLKQKIKDKAIDAFKL